MTTPSSDRLETLFHQALELPEAARAAFVDDAAGDDAELRAELRRLLEHDSAAETGFLRSPVDVDADGFALKPGELVAGRYRLVEVIGEGGMGAVWRAEQDHPRRSVALKVIRSGVAARELLRRFELEASVLARLSHPGVAHVFDAGVWETPAGSCPFFVMELVEGAPLLEYAAAKNLSTGDRLQLFVDVCDAVSHAHQKGVIHRDLKPANILVTDEGCPKVLDFGVARLTESDVQMTSVRTDHGAIIGTLPYMSPEQVEGDVSRIDTRSDVYSLGVILYELLTDRPPYDVKGKSIAHAARVIAEEQPSPISSVDRTLRGDLSTITQKALEKEPARRYASASDLAADVTRYLSDEPILARPPTTMYQFRKFARRNRALVGGAAATFLVLLLGVIGTTFGMVTAREALVEVEAAGQEADRQARIAQAVNDFLTDDLLAQADPLEGADREITLREALDRAAQRIGGAFPDEPVVEANIRTTLGDAYSNLGEFDRAEPQLMQAMSLYRDALGDDHRDTLVAQLKVADLYTKQGRLDEAESLLLETLELQKTALGEDDPHTLSTMNNLASVYWRQGRFAEVEPLWLHVLEVRRNSPEIEAWRTATTMNNVAALYNYLGRYDDAEEMLLQAIDLRREVRGPEHPDTLQSMHNLAWLYSRQGRRDESIALNRELMETRRRVLGEDHPDTLFSMGNLAGELSQAEEYEESRALYDRVLEARRRVLGERHPQTIATIHDMASLALEQKNYERAEPIFQEAIALFREEMRPDFFRTGVALHGRGRCLLELGRHDDAEQCLLDGYEILVASMGEGHDYTTSCLRTIVEFYNATGDGDAAAEYQAKLDRAVAGAPPEEDEEATDEETDA